ncbi:MAG: hypothetical protein GXX91_11810 [Verrucomicrobiaceae bacterium]|nr:hypothetical protein [Verrucomicrobiaceae bacterium]
MNSKLYPRHLIAHWKATHSTEVDHASTHHTSPGILARIASYLRTHPLGCEIAAIRIQG